VNPTCDYIGDLSIAGLTSIFDLAIKESNFYAEAFAASCKNLLACIEAKTAALATVAA